MQILILDVLEQVDNVFECLLLDERAELLHEVHLLGLQIFVLGEALSSGVFRYRVA